MSTESSTDGWCARFENKHQSLPVYSAIGLFHGLLHVSTQPWMDGAIGHTHRKEGSTLL